MSTITRATVRNGVVSLSPSWQEILQQIREWEGTVPSTKEVWNLRDSAIEYDRMYDYLQDEQKEAYHKWLTS